MGLNVRRVKFPKDRPLAAGSGAVAAKCSFRAAGGGVPALGWPGRPWRVLLRLAVQGRLLSGVVQRLPFRCLGQRQVGAGSPGPSGARRTRVAGCGAAGLRCRRGRGIGSGLGVAAGVGLGTARREMGRNRPKIGRICAQLATSSRCAGRIHVCGNRTRPGNRTHI